MMIQKQIQDITAAGSLILLGSDHRNRNNEKRKRPRAASECSETSSVENNKRMCNEGYGRAVSSVYSSSNSSVFGSSNSSTASSRGTTATAPSNNTMTSSPRLLTLLSSVAAAEEKRQLLRPLPSVLTNHAVALAANSSVSKSVLNIITSTNNTTVTAPTTDTKKFQPLSAKPCFREVMGPPSTIIVPAHVSFTSETETKASEEGIHEGPAIVPASPSPNIMEVAKAAGVADAAAQAIRQLQLNNPSSVATSTPTFTTNTSMGSTATASIVPGVYVPQLPAVSTVTALAAATQLALLQQQQIQQQQHQNRQRTQQLLLAAQRYKQQQAIHKAVNTGYNKIHRPLITAPRLPTANETMKSFVASNGGGVRKISPLINIIL